jgi:hypothetical protein
MSKSAEPDEVRAPLPLPRAFVRASSFFLSSCDPSRPRLFLSNGSPRADDVPERDTH